MENISRKLKEINSRMLDEESRYVFMNRFMYSLTDDSRYIANLCTKKLDTEKKYILWGRGYWGKEIVDCYPNINWIGVCDNNEKLQKEPFLGLEPILLKEIDITDIDLYVVIGTRKYNKEIYEQLIRAGVDAGHIVNYGDIQEQTSSKIYFDIPYFKICEDEVFVDAGAYTGDTITDFIKWNHGRYKAVYAFEPDTENAQKCKLNLGQENRINIFTQALSDTNEDIMFKMTGDVFSKMQEECDGVIVRGIRLDDVIRDEKVTFIKMDVEGMESRAIQGMSRIIQRDTPKMAISIYHKPSDVIELPMALIALNPRYRFCLRHYSIGKVDTVLYAIDENELNDIEIGSVLA